jgi:imidazolonepropionase-like amidohydrolase
VTQFVCTIGLAVAAWLLGSGLFRGAPAKPSLVVIDHVSVIDVTGGPSRADQTVIIAGDTIRAVTNSGSIRFPAGAQLIDARGKFLIPGLWDMHTHIAGISAQPSW